MYLRIVCLFLIIFTIYNCSAEDVMKRISEEKCTEYQEIYREILPNPLPHISRKPIVRGLLCPPNKQGLIVGGREAQPEEFPHMAFIEFKNKRGTHSCGGTLISSNYVLTAAHCFFDQKTSERDSEPSLIILGDISLEESKAQSTRQVFTEFNTIVHSEYEPKVAQYNDIALIKLIQSNLSFKATIKPDLSIRPACLPPSGQDIITETDIVIGSGWGYTSPTSDVVSKTLRAVNLTIHDNDDVCDICWRNKVPGFASLYPDGFQDSMLCAGDDGKDTCGGDSGGPITIRPLRVLDCMDFIVGITSTGSRGCGNGIPAAYTRVDKYLDWIEERVWNKEK